MTTQDTLAFLLANSEEFELDSDDKISIAATLCNLQDNQYVMDYKKYPHFDLEKYSNEEFVKQFWFQKMDIAKLCQSLGLNGTIVYSNRVTCQPIEALCMVLCWLAYPNRLCDLCGFFGRSECEISTIVSETIAYLVRKHSQRMNDCFANWLDHPAMAKIVHRKGYPMTNVWGFIDSTLMRTCQPKYNQMELFSGHKWYHSIKYQTVMAPNRMIVHV